MHRIICAYLLILVVSFTQDKAFYGKVIRIIDGDTIVVLTKMNEQITVRLAGIDCPEKNQDFGTRAKQGTSILCFNKQVKIVPSGKDKYGRTIGFVFIDEICINEELLKLGLAWHYKKFNQDENLAQLEWTARTNKVGLWSLYNPIPPWDFRANRSGKS